MPDALNADVSFHELPPTHRTAFVERPPERRLIPKGTLLYKLTSSPFVDGKGRVTPWWFGVEPLSADDPGFHGSAERAVAVGTPFERFARVRGAVCFDWNDCGRAVFAELLVPAYGFVGRCSGQPEWEKAPAWWDPRDPMPIFIGGAWQVHISNLKPTLIRRANPQPGNAAAVEP